MALQGWDKNYREKLKIQQEVIESLQQQLMISGGNPGGVPNRPWDDPSKEKGPFVPAPPRDKLAHGEHFGEYGEIIQDPGFGTDPGGNPIRLPHMEQTPEEAERNRQLHILKFHQAMAGPDYIGDKLRYGQLDRILNPLGDFRKPTLDQLRIHSRAYPKA